MKKVIVAIALAVGLGGAAFTAVAQDEGTGKDDSGMQGHGSMMQGDMTKMMSRMGPTTENCNPMMSTMNEKMEGNAPEKSPSNG